MHYLETIMAKEKGISGMSGWVFITVGFVLIAVSIFFYDTLKIFVALGGLMTIYGLGKLSYDRFKAQIFPKDEDDKPLDLNKTTNPYLQQKPQQQAPMQHVLSQHKRAAPIVHPQQQRPSYPQQPVHRTPSHSPTAKYCHSCGSPLHPHHRFCSSCGARLQ